MTRIECFSTRYFRKTALDNTRVHDEKIRVDQECRNIEAFDSFFITPDGRTAFDRTRRTAKKHA